MNLKKKPQTNNTIASFFASSLTGKKLRCLTTDMGMLQLKAVGYNEVNRGEVGVGEKTTIDCYSEHCKGIPLIYENLSNIWISNWM